MAKLYRLLYFKSTGVFIILFMLSFSLHAQEMLQGVLRMKVNEALASTLEQRTFARSTDGNILTGVQSIDQLNRQFNVRKFTRVFPHAGKNEARHRKYGLHRWYEVTLDKRMPIAHVLQSYQSDKRILKVEPVYKKAIIGSGSPSFGPRLISQLASANGVLTAPFNDPLINSQWHYHNTGQSGGSPNADISLFEAWKIQTGEPDVIIAVTDGGVDVDHPDLMPNLWTNKGEVPDNNLDDDNNGYVDDVHGFSFVHGSGSILPDNHGTHVAGTVGAVTNNHEGVAGVAGGSGKGDGVRIMSAAVFHADSLSDGFAEAYVYSADNGAVISQNSWGYTLPGVFEQVVLDAIDYFIAEAGKNEAGQQTGPMNGGLAIFSAGNYDTEGDYYPAAYEPVLAVASSTHQDKRAQYSNYGAWVDITAPGGETYQNREEGVISTLPFGSYGWYMGTSMACPHVSGVAGLVVSEFGRQGLTPHTVRQRLIQSVDNIYTLNPGFKGKLGSGRLNAHLALRQGDQRAPEPILDLRVASKDVGQITLSWTAPPDPGGFVTAYDLRYSTRPITEANFDGARPVSGLPAPRAAGAEETFTVRDLPGGVQFYFAIRSVDFEQNVSRLSNVVAETSARTPIITVSPKSLSTNLKTAEVSRQSIVITNSGEGPLKYSISLSEAPHPFVNIKPTEGIVQAHENATVTLQLDAAGLLAGKYRQTLTISSNDPVTPSVELHVSLVVTNNGFPIASINPLTIDFKSAQVGSTVSRKVIVANAGSESLIINKISFDNKSFKSTTKLPLTIRPFEDAEVEITFTPSQIGKVPAEILLQTNDPSKPTIKITAAGEGLHEPPLVASPRSFDETLDRGTTVTKEMLLTNNGSHDRKIRIEVGETRLENDRSSASSRKAANTTTSPNDSLRSRRRDEMLQKHRAALAMKGESELRLLRSIGQGSTQGRTSHARKDQSQAGEVREYTTGFEEFNAGPISEQYGWFASTGWDVVADNAPSGSQHLRGKGDGADGSERYALSPYLFEGDEYLYPRYTSTSMRINADGARGTSWEIVPQDPWSYIATRIRFNADGTIDAFVIDNDYEFHWKRVPVTAPKGYFDVAIEYNNWGSDTSGFPTYYLFINNHHVFSGTGLGSAIGQVAFVTQTEAVGPVFDVDDFNLSGGEYIPDFLTTFPSEGTVPAGESVAVSVEFDATIMKYGSYDSEILVHLDDTDTLVVPAALTVTGEASLVSDLWGVHMRLPENEEGWQEMTLMNTGGRAITYDFETDVPGLTVAPQAGTLEVRENESITITFSNTPGFYNGELRLHNDAGEDVIFPVTIIVYEDDAKFSAPATVRYDVRAGQINTQSLWLKNEGSAVSYYVTPSVNSEPYLNVYPSSATFEDSLEVILTIDARSLSAGPETWWLDFTTNDAKNEQVYVNLELNVLPDTITAGRINREVWTNIPGKTVSLIPLHTAPQSKGLLKLFESSPDEADNYGSRVRGYVQAPVSGYYTFYISSDDQSELWLSDDDSEKQKKKIAWVTGSTGLRLWTKFASQTSAQIYLEENRKYYIEALHKESTGGDHLSVGWHEESIGFERPIPGLRLIPYEATMTNKPPVVNVISPSEGDSFVAPATVEITADVRDADGTVAKVEFYEGDNMLGVDVSAPYSFTWANLAQGEYELTVKATDNLGAVDSVAVHISVGDELPCADAGTITREEWDNVRGSNIKDIPLKRDPSAVSTLTIFESPEDIGDHYGARIRGYVCVPESGKYTFWISGNDRSELWLSPDADVENKSRIAFVNKPTGKREWNKRSSQKSRDIYLEQGKLYYIEALHKEGKGDDHLSVGWQLPDGTMERPIPGSRLIPFERNERILSVVLTSPHPGETFSAPASVNLSASVTPNGTDIAGVAFYSGDAIIGEDQSSPYNLTWSDVETGRHVITAVVKDIDGRSAVSTPVPINVEGTCQASGTITREYWTGIRGSSVASIPVHTPPDGQHELTGFKGPDDAGSNYGARIRGFICPPQTGEYFFSITSTGESELWLSSDDSPANIKRIAMVRERDDDDDDEEEENDEDAESHDLPFQRSKGIRLIKGHTYYVEALHKHGKGKGRIAVGWQLPDRTVERPIAGSHLSPFSGSAAVLPGEGGPHVQMDTLANQRISVQAYPNPVHGDALNIEIEHGDAPEDVTHEIVIRQLTGLAIYSEKVNCANRCSREIDVTRDLPPGVYILQVRVGEKIFTEKLLVD